MSYDDDAATSLDELAARSTVVIKAKLIDGEDGRIYGSSPDDPTASRHLNLVFDSVSGQRFCVGVSRPRESSVDRLREVFPNGADSVIYLQPNNDPLEGWLNARADGNERFFTTPQGWIVEITPGVAVAPFEPLDNLSFAIPPDGEIDLDT